jgi:hypothetical protein
MKKPKGAYERERRAFVKQFREFHAPMLDGLNPPARARLTRRINAYAREVYDYIGPRGPNLEMPKPLEHLRKLLAIHDAIAFEHGSKLDRRKVTERAH